MSKKDEIICLYDGGLKDEDKIANRLNTKSAYVKKVLCQHKLMTGISTLDKIKSQHGHPNFSLALTGLGLIIASVSLWYAVTQLELALYQIEYPNLDVTNIIDEQNGRLTVFIKNNALNKETGTINFYRMGISDSVPHMQLKSLGPGDEINLSLSINVSYVQYPIESHVGESPVQTGFTIPAQKLYYITEAKSLVYKITCDNCYSQGIINRIPDYQQISTQLQFTGDYNNVSARIPIYSWTTYSLDDLV